MARDWEAQLRLWAQPPGATEREKMENAESQIREAIRRSTKLGAHTIEVFAQGSYRNRTNVPRESDVDVCVVCKDTFGLEWRTNQGTPIGDPALIAAMRRDLDISDATYAYSEYKDDVEQALVERFGRAAVKRCDKAFDVHETSTRVDSDVLAAFAHRRYSRASDGTISLQEGTKFYPDSGGEVINFPQQQYDNGVAKNATTGERYKAMVRALKNLRNEMDDNRIEAAKPIPSFLIECLVYNVPDGKFGSSYIADMKSVIAVAWNATKTDESCNEWLEVSRLKWLFRPSQPWTRQEANDFLHAAWNYDGLGSA